MQVGFIHGVMNTDNMTISGETIDYGPCAFMDGYDPATVFSSIDHQGRYAFGNQPRIAHWNLARLADTLLPLFADNHDKAIALAEDTINQYSVLSTPFDLKLNSTTYSAPPSRSGRGRSRHFVEPDPEWDIFCGFAMLPRRS